MRIQSTTTPINRPTFNEWAVMIREETNKKYKVNEKPKRNGTSH